VSSSIPFPEWLSIAEGLAQEASQAILGFLNNPIVTSRKADHSLVTEADLRSDEILRGGLAEHFPGHAILTEENGLSGDPNSEFVWLIDPLDGTKAFAKGIPGFCVMVGLLQAGRPCLGVLVDPLEGRVYRGQRGMGATHTWRGRTQVLRVSERSEMPEMPLVVSTGFPETALKKIQAALPGPLLSPINSVGIKVGLLVRREADIYINHHEVNYWDTCAPQLILEEAGGVFTNLDGGELAYPLIPPFNHRMKTLASNGARHRELVKILKSVPL